MTSSLRTALPVLLLALGLGSGCSVIVNNKTQCVASECDDGNACTNDYCGNGACQHDLIDEDGDGYAPLSCYASDAGATAGDCDDSNSNAHPGASEQCNGVDDNCNGLVDDGAPQVTCYRDADMDGYHNASMPMQATCTCPDGYILPNAAGADCDDSKVQVHPGAPEQCGNGIDDNCNGVIDSDVTTTFTCQRDADGDGFGDPNPATSQVKCACDPGYIIPNSGGDDCADGVANAYPGSTTAATAVPYCLGGNQTQLATVDGASPTGYSCPVGFTQRWDYDCDNVESQYWTATSLDATSCLPPCSGMFCLSFCSDGWASSVAAACGRSATFRDGTCASGQFGCFGACATCTTTTMRQRCK